MGISATHTVMLSYALSGVAYLTFVAYGYQAAQSRALILGWTFIAAIAAAMLIAWITIINLLYLLVQIALAVEGVGLTEAYRAVAGFIYAEFRELAGVFAVVLALVIAATLASALAWSRSRSSSNWDSRSSSDCGPDDASGLRLRAQLVPSPQ